MADGDLNRASLFGRTTVDTANRRNRLPVSRVTRTKSQARSTYNRLSRCYDLLAGGFEGRFRNVDCRPIPVQESLHDVGFHILQVERRSLFGLWVELVLAEKPL